MRYIWISVLSVVLLAACALPEGVFTFDTRLPEPTAWEGGPVMATEEAMVEATAVAIATEEAPQEESTPEPADCLVKANVGRNGSKIYHLPTGAYYEIVIVDESQGDAWYCGPEEAEAAGFRRSLR